MKRLNIRDGVVMGHPYEVAERMQEYANANLERLMSALFESRGHLAPHTDELRVRLRQEGGNIQIVAEPGYAVCEKGLLRLPSPTSITRSPDRLGVSGSSSTSTFVNLVYTEVTATPVDLVPYGSGEADLEIRPQAKLQLGDSAIGINGGVPLARIDAGEGSWSVTDLRPDYAASLRPDRSMLYDLVDPALVEDIETIFSRDDVVEEISQLLDEKLLQGEYVVTRLKDAVEPFFVRTSYEPALREKLRDLNAIDADVNLEPTPDWSLKLEWNLYGVTAEHQGGADVSVSSGFDLTQVDYTGYDTPLFLRYEGEEHPIASIVDADTVRLESNLAPSQLSDPNAAITNGADEFHVSAEPGIKWFRKGKRSQDFAVDSGVREPVAHLDLEPGFWNIVIQATGDNSRSSRSIGVEIPELREPKQPAQLSLTGEQREPATDEDQGPKPANPFKNIETDENGQPIIPREKIDRYINYIREELKRIQEMEVALEIAITPQPRNRDEAKRAMTVGYQVDIEMMTGQGWKKERSMRLFRPTEDLVQEISWLDLISNRYRGSVEQQSDLTNLSHNMERLDRASDAARPIRENDVVYVRDDLDSINNGYWRYEPKMSSGEALTNSSGESIRTYPYNTQEGAWVQMDIEKGAFQGEPVTTTLTGIKGGADYRATVRPIGENGKVGDPLEDYTEELRDKFNAKLGYDFHRAINDIYSAYKKIVDDVDPGKFDEYLKNRLEEIRSLIDRTAQYGAAPKVSGPFEVPLQPGVTRFSGQRLGSVQSVKMRYAPPGKTDEEQVIKDAQFKVLVGTGDPQVVVRNLPNYSQLSRKAAPVVTLEFNAGAKGSDFVQVRYSLNNPTVFGPSVARFAESNVSDVTNALTYGNTASYWYYMPDPDGEPLAVGPLPKRWPGEKSWDAANEVFTQNWKPASISNLRELSPNTSPQMVDNPSVQTNAPDAPVNCATLTFDAKHFQPEYVVDVRVRQLPTEKLVPQIANKGRSTWENKVSEPYYYALTYNQGEVNVHVPVSALHLWYDRNFTLEWLFYPSTPASGVNKGRSAFLDYRGEHASAPANPNRGDYYTNSGNGTSYVYEGGEWQEAANIDLERHRFTIKRQDDQDFSQDVEVRFIADAQEGSPPEDKIEFHTPEQSGGGEVPFSKDLKLGSNLEVRAPLTYNDGGTTMVADAIATRPAPENATRQMGPKQAAIDATNKFETFGSRVLKGTAPIEGAANDRMGIIVHYKPLQTFTGDIASWDGINPTLSLDGISDDVVLDRGGRMHEEDAPAGTNIEIDGILLTHAGSHNTQIVRAIDYQTTDTADLFIDGPSNVPTLTPTTTLNPVFTTNADVQDSDINITWASGSAQLSDWNYTTTTVADTKEIELTLNWRDFWGDEVIDLQPIRPTDDIGEGNYDDPTHREDEVFDYRSQSHDLKTVSLKVSVTRDGVTKDRFLNVTVSPTQRG